ncbi:MAG: YigZ family protein [Caldilineaceae bacterium]|nr:YigZ family protein [Caldilineaceae bacterium]
MTSSDRYPIPAARHRVAEEVRRSRFITTVGHAPTLDAARDFIASVRAEFADASHNCWAYVVGPPGSTAQIGMSDDGEPHGTAGRPMLTVLLHADIGEIVAVVTRYFGGTLLGTGGLVKAYSGGVQLALATLPVVERVPRVTMELVVEYGAVTPLQRLLSDYEVQVLDQQYAADVTYRLKLPQEHADSFTARVVELTNGQALVDLLPVA